MLRREGLYTSHIAEWRKVREGEALSGLEAKKTRGAKRSPEQLELDKLRRQIGRLQTELERNRPALDVMGKAHALLELLSESADTTDVDAIVGDAAGGVKTVGTKMACLLLGVSRATHYRRLNPPPPTRGPSGPDRAVRGGACRRAGAAEPSRALGPGPGAGVGAAARRGPVLVLESTMYRILRAPGQIGERRAQATHPARKKPELVADAPNQVWCWDITKLRGPARGVYYHLYTIIDIWSRYVVGCTCRRGRGRRPGRGVDRRRRPGRAWTPTSWSSTPTGARR